MLPALEIAVIIDKDMNWRLIYLEVSSAGRNQENNLYQLEEIID